MSAENRDVARGAIAPHGETRPLRVPNSRLGFGRPLVVMLAVTLVCGSGPSVSQAAEPPAVPASFAEVAAAALAASFVADVVAGGPGATAGLRPGDIIVGIGTTPISSRLQFERAVGALDPDDVLALKVRRGGRGLVISARLAEDPEGMPVRPEARLAKRRLGIEVRPINPIEGAVANDVDFSGSAGRAGIKAGDVIREVNGQPIQIPADFEAAGSALTPGAPILMRVQRRDVIFYVAVDAVP